MCKRPLQDSGSSVDKRQRLSSDTSEIGETKESDALPEYSAGETKEDRAADRLRQRHANSSESQSPPCIAVLYTYIKGRTIKRKWVKGQFVQSGNPITFTSRVKAGECFGGINRKKIGDNINNKQRSKIKGGKYDGQYVMFSNKPVESIMFEGIEIKPAPAPALRVNGQKYVHNGIVRIWNGHSNWKCVEHNKTLSKCVECGGGGGLCPCGIIPSRCRICRVQPLLHCTECPTTWTSQDRLDNHMRTHTGEKPYECHLCSVKFAQNGDLTSHMRTHTGEKPYECHLCNYKCTSNGGLSNHMRTHTGEKPYECHLCPYKGAQSGHLTSHKGLIHGIGNEQCTICWDNCYRPRSWIDPETTEVERSCKKCYQDRFGVNIREEQEWSDWLDERFYPEFRTCSDTRISMCTLFFPDGLYEFEGQMILYFDHLILHWEFDEHQHSGENYSGDENRMLKMHEIEKYKYKHWVTVRINPHGYTHPDRYKRKPEKEERKELMLKVMKACLTKLWESRTNVVYMFYSKNNPNIAQRISKTMLYDAEDVDEFCKN